MVLPLLLCLSPSVLLLLLCYNRDDSNVAALPQSKLAPPRGLQCGAAAPSISSAPRNAIRVLPIVPPAVIVCRQELCPPT